MYQIRFLCLYSGGALMLSNPADSHAEFLFCTHFRTPFLTNWLIANTQSVSFVHCFASPSKKTKIMFPLHLLTYQFYWFWYSFSFAKYQIWRSVYAIFVFNYLVSLPKFELNLQNHLFLICLTNLLPILHN